MLLELLRFSGQEMARNLEEPAADLAVIYISVEMVI
jgi:hypothetical protein